MSIFTRLLWLWAIGLLLPSVCLAGGFFIDEQGARRTGMAGASVAAEGDPSGLFHNPAALTDLVRDDRPRSFVSLTYGRFYRLRYHRSDDVIAGQARSYEPVDSSTDQLAVPLVAAVFPSPWERLAWSVQLSIPFGAMSNYPDQGPQRYNLLFDRFGAVTAGPQAAWRFSPELTVGAGISLVWGRLDYERSLDGIYYLTDGETRAEHPDSTVDGSARLTGWSIAPTLGLQYRPAGPFRLGLAWRGPIDLDLDGSLQARYPPALQELLDLGRLERYDARVKLDLPQGISLGGEVDLPGRLRLALEVSWMDWSVFRETRIEIQQAPLGIEEILILRDWRDSWTYRAGLAWQARSDFRLSLGYAWDETPIPDETAQPDIPDSDKHVLAVGAGWVLDSGWELDLAYQHKLFQVRRVSDSRLDPPANGRIDVDWGSLVISLNAPF